MQQRTVLFFTEMDNARSVRVIEQLRALVEKDPSHSVLCSTQSDNGQLIQNVKDVQGRIIALVDRFPGGQRSFRPGVVSMTDSRLPTWVKAATYFVAIGEPCATNYARCARQLWADFVQGHKDAPNLPWGQSRQGKVSTSRIKRSDPPATFVAHP